MRRFDRFWIWIHVDVVSFSPCLWRTPALLPPPPSSSFRPLSLAPPPPFSSSSHPPPVSSFPPHTSSSSSPLPPVASAPPGFCPPLSSSSAAWSLSSLSSPATQRWWVKLITSCSLSPVALVGRSLTHQDGGELHLLVDVAGVELAVAEVLTDVKRKLFVVVSVHDSLFRAKTCDDALQSPSIIRTDDN